jgi:hypothetical protein
MKKVILLLFMIVIALSGTAFAQPFTGIASESNSSALSNAASNSNSNQTQGQSQGQTQGQTQSSTSGAASTSSGNTSGNQVQGQVWQQTISDTLQNIPNTPLFPFPISLIQGGKVGDVTDQLPKFKGLKPLKVGNGDSEEVEEVEVFSGSIFGRTRLQDLWPDILKYHKKVLEKGWDPAKIRYRVYYKDSAVGSGIGGGANLGASGTSGSNGVQGLGAILPGHTRSTTDPMYILIFCKVS